MENSKIRDIMEVDLPAYFEKHKDNVNWINSIKRFPEPLQREITVERPDGSEKSVKELVFITYHDDVLRARAIELVNRSRLLNAELESLTLEPQFTSASPARRRAIT